jgi:hypothetical protein
VPLITAAKWQGLGFLQQAAFEVSLKDYNDNDNDDNDDNDNKSSSSHAKGRINFKFQVYAGHRNLLDSKSVQL